MGGESVGYASVVEVFPALEVFDVAMVTIFVTESRLASDGGTIRHVVMTEDSLICLRQVLGRLDGGVSL